MATIKFKLNGTYYPFVAELRENNATGNLIQELIVRQPNTEYEFNNISGGTYAIVAYDRIGGIISENVNV